MSLSPKVWRETSLKLSMTPFPPRSTGFLLSDFGPNNSPQCLLELSETSHTEPKRISLLRAATASCYRLGGWDNRNLFPQFWKLQVQDQGVCWLPLKPLSLPCRQPATVSSRGCPFVCVVCVLISSYKDSCVVLGLISSSFYLTYFFKGLSSKYSHASESWGLGLPRSHLEGAQQHGEIKSNPVGSLLAKALFPSHPQLHGSLRWQQWTVFVFISFQRPYLLLGFNSKFSKSFIHTSY